MKVIVYVEGGGGERATKARCREGFSELLAKAAPGKQRPRIVASGGRNNTFRDFVTGSKANPDALVLLLVDAEAPVTAADPWSHLQMQEGWRPALVDATDRAHLMVQVMEAWFLADRSALAAYYGQGFQSKALPEHTNPEQVDKATLHRALVAATKNSRTKGVYHKTRHGFELLALIAPERVAATSPHAQRFFHVLRGG